jgi:hypothetical protein
MAVVDLICLANSYKNGCRCIAGLRVDRGGWVRPVSGRPEGELEPRHYLLDDGSEPGLLDVVRVGLANPQPSAHQPENWRIDGARWKLMERPASPAHAPAVAASVLRGARLFGHVGRSIPYSDFLQRPAEGSLAIVEPFDVTWRVGTKARVQFAIGGAYCHAYYDLPLTDPAWLNRVKALGPGDHSSLALGIPPGRNVLLTISLSEPLEGSCYKLVAGVVILPASWL